jgi:adenine-specific DNA-methyltransferase
MTAFQLPADALHPAQRRYIAEDLMRRRRSDEQRRYAAPQRAAKIDANPHQIDAVIFALARLREGGCILADEVGLGKTIEAGLVMAQLMAEGARRVLLVAPKPLLGQWRQELFQLFDIEAREATPDLGAFDGDGVFLIGREAAGSQRGRDALLAAEPFDLWVIDEAHEVFAGIYKRFDQFGGYKEDAPNARTAGRVRDVLFAQRSPVLLLTATPIQNSLLELWGLVQYVDPLGTLLGDLATFRELFCGSDDRQLAPGQEAELRSRLRLVLQRTLRRQAREFLERPFVERQARLFEYPMSPDERALYDDVTRYLLEPGIFAFRGNQRQLLLLGFHRRMGSSTRALAASLGRVAARLRRMLAGDRSAEADEQDARSMVDDLDGADVDVDHDAGETGGGDADEVPDGTDPEAVRAELRRVEGFIARAEALGRSDSKFLALLKALDFVTTRARAGQGAGKLVIFTESLVTQDYLRDRLIESRLVTDDEVTVFRGVNDSKRVQQALERWEQDTPQGEGPPPSADIARRLALVHEFRTRSRVFISTEAGAKGLNLQFCDAIVNYDLPWNPQRIEQRIGRCHRYGQQHDVTVINFLAKDNEAQRLTFEILSQKLELFGTVLDASDQVLHRSDGADGGTIVNGAEFEAELRRIYDRSRTLEEVTKELHALRERVADERRRYEEAHARTASLIEERFDEGVQRVFRQHQTVVPRALAELDRDLLAVTISYLEANNVPFQRITDAVGVELLRVAPSTALPGTLSEGITVAIGASKEHTSMHLGHPLVVAAVADARAVGASLTAWVRLPEGAPEQLRKHAGQRGCLRLVKVSFDGFELTELLVPIVAFEGGEFLDPSLGEVLLRSELRSSQEAMLNPLRPELLDDAVGETLFSLQSAVDEAEQARFERAVRQGERFIEDRVLVLKKKRDAIALRLEQALLRRDGATGAEARTEAERAIVSAQVALDEVEGSIARLEKRDDETFRRFETHIHQRRYVPPHVEPLFDLNLVIE